MTPTIPLHTPELSTDVEAANAVYEALAATEDPRDHPPEWLTCDLRHIDMGEYTYTDEDGAPLFLVRRLGPNLFSRFRPDSMTGSAVHRYGDRRRSASGCGRATSSRASRDKC